MQVLDIDRARAALLALDSGVPRDEWVRVGMAAKAAGIPFDDWHDWSAPAGNYKSEADCRSVWRSIDETGGIGAGTLFAMAREAGWQEPVNGRDRPVRKTQERPKQHDKARQPVVDYSAVVRDSVPATAEHPYIKRKLGIVDGELRVYHGPLRLAGVPLDGALIVIARDVAEFASWQAILPDGTKRNMPGSMKGFSHMVGGVTRAGEPLFVVEGIGQAWSAHQATRAPAACCFGASNMEAVAQQMCERYPLVDLVIVADAGKDCEAERIARAVGGRFVTMPPGSPSNFDLNDLHVRDGLQAVADLLAQAQAPESGLPKLKTAAELLKQEFAPIRWLVPGLLPEGLMLLAARPKVGKSWLALDVALACATGGRVLDRPVARGDVLYLALEDNDRRMHSRLSKLCAAGEGLGDFEYATEWPRGAEGAAAIHEWINAHPKARLVVIDVFSKLRAAAEGRESAYSTDYTDVTMLKPPPDRAVSILLVHHTRKAESDDPIDAISGTLGIGGAADGAWVIKRARGSDEAELHLVGRDLEEEGAFAVRFDRATCRWSWVGEAWRVRVSAERRQVLAVLAMQPMKPNELAREIGKSQGAVRKILHDMVADGQVDRGMDGKYRSIEPEGAFQ